MMKNTTILSQGYAKQLQLRNKHMEYPQYAAA